MMTTCIRLKISRLLYHELVTIQKQFDGWLLKDVIDPSDEFHDLDNHNVDMWRHLNNRVSSLLNTDELDSMSPSKSKKKT